MAEEMQADLVERARRGDRGAFEQLAEREVDRLLAIAGLILRDHDLAEDATQEALIRCWRQLPKLRDVEKFDGWLYRILVRAAIDESKRNRRLAANIDLARVEPAFDAIAVIADREQLERGFRRLSINHRAVVVLRHYVGLPLKDVAMTLGIPEGTARSRYHFAMSALRAALEAESRLAVNSEVLS
jgi:RNA polymerase sigma-70 factor (ECF subfamily)